MLKLRWLVISQKQILVMTIIVNTSSAVAAKSRSLCSVTPLCSETPCAATEFSLGHSHSVCREISRVAAGEQMMECFEEKIEWSEWCCPPTARLPLSNAISLRLTRLGPVKMAVAVCETLMGKNRRETLWPHWPSLLWLIIQINSTNRCQRRSSLGDPPNNKGIGGVLPWVVALMEKALV